MEAPTDEVIELLASALELHPLAVEDSKEFDQRGKLVVYGDVVMTVGFGLDKTAGEPIEVHGYLTERFLITFRQTGVRPLTDSMRWGRCGSCSAANRFACLIT